MKLLFDESLSPRLAVLLRDLFPESESALRNGLARAGDRRIRLTQAGGAVEWTWPTPSDGTTQRLPE